MCRETITLYLASSNVKGVIPLDYILSVYVKLITANISDLIDFRIVNKKKSEDLRPLTFNLNESWDIKLNRHSQTSIK